MTKKKITPKVYEIKIPVYVSELIDKPYDLFGGITFQHMIKYIKNKVDDYNIHKSEITNKRRNKTIEKHIKEIKCYDVPIGNESAILLKITAFNTNLLDGFYEKENRIEFTKESKVGSDNNFMLIYPNIFGTNPTNYRYQWVVLLYEDPNKENAEIVATAKLVINRVLDIEVKNIKLNTVIEQLKENEYTPELNIKITSISMDSNDVFPEFRVHLVSSRTKTMEEFVYKNLPTDDAINLITKKDIISKGQHWVKRVILGRKEFKVTQSFNEEANERIKEVVEEIYNSGTFITEEELQHDVYNINFVIRKLTPILKDYLQGSVINQ